MLLDRQRADEEVKLRDVPRDRGHPAGIHLNPVGVAVAGSDLKYDGRARFPGFQICFFLLRTFSPPRFWYVSALSRVDFPAEEGPMTATNSPFLTYPDTFLMMEWEKKQGTNYVNTFFGGFPR